jgi:hypothetical protein
MIGDPIPAGTNSIPTYLCSTCHDSGEKLDLSNGARAATFIKCPDCDGIPRLCGEIDAPEKCEECGVGLGENHRAECPWLSKFLHGTDVEAIEAPPP